MGLLDAISGGIGVDNPFGSIGQGDGTISGFLNRTGVTGDTGVMNQVGGALGIGGGVQTQSDPLAGATALAGTAPAVPTDRAKIGSEAMQFFMSKGLSPAQAAGLAGNFAWESGGKTDEVSPNDNLRHSPNSPHSAGIAQWNDRLPALIQSAREAGVPVPNGDLRNAADVKRMISAIPLKQQLEFAWKELNGSEGRALKGLQAAQDPQAATAAAIGYHRPAGWTLNNPTAGHGFSQRLALAQGLLAQNAAPTQDPLGAPPPTGLTSPLAGAVAGTPAPTMGGVAAAPPPQARPPRAPRVGEDISRSTDPEDAAKLLAAISQNFVRPEAPQIRRPRRNFGAV